MSVGATKTPAATELSVIAPCLNEEANVGVLAERTLAALDALGVMGELVLVDDGSWDRTWGAIEQAHRTDGRVRGVRHAQNRGIEAAWRTGLSAARGRLVCLIDSDLQNRPEDICLLYDYYRRGTCDIVQAVRHPARKGERCRVFTRGLNVLLNAVFRTRLRDNKSGFLLCRRDVLGCVLAHRFRYRYFQCFVGVAARTRGFAIGEVDTAFDLRHAGRSFLPHRPVRVSLHVLWELIQFRVEASAWRRGRRRVAARGAAARRNPIVADAPAHAFRSGASPT